MKRVGSENIHQVLQSEKVNFVILRRRVHIPETNSIEGRVCTCRVPVWEVWMMSMSLL